MFRKKSNLKECLRVLEEDLKDNKIHASTFWNAITSLDNCKDRYKFFKSVKNFYKKIIKQELKKKIYSTLTMDILDGKKSIDDIAKDCTYRRIAENLPSHPVNNETKELWVMNFPLLESYYKNELSYKKDLEVGYLF